MRLGYTGRMRGCRMCVAAAIATIVLAPPASLAQQPPAAAATTSRDAIARDLDKIKKGRTLAITPSDGTDEPDGVTVLQFENSSPFPMVILVVGPTTERIELGSERMQTLTVQPGDYELAMTVVGRDLPPFYGRQKVVESLAFRHRFIIPGL